MPDENLLSTLEQGLRHSRATRSRLASRLADLEAEAERVRTELNEMDAIISQTEAAMFRILSSSFGVAASHSAPSDVEIEVALRRDAVRNGQTAAPSYQPQPAPRVAHVPREHIPAPRPNIEPSTDRFFERPPHAAGRPS